MKAIYWIRNDLRLQDNLTLHKFCEQAAEGLVVWCASSSFQRAGEFRRSFILQSVEQFAAALRERGLSVLLSSESAGQLIPALARRHAVDCIFVSAEASPEERREEELVAKEFSGHFLRVDQLTLLSRDDLPFTVQDTPEVFTQFRLLIEKDLRVPDPIPEPKRWPKGLALGAEPVWNYAPTLAIHPQIKPGEAAGLAHLREYIWERDRLRVYKETRNGMLAWDDSSKLSPWLTVGSLSARFIYQEIQRYELERCKNESTYWLFFELLWRDYFRFILEKKQAKLFGRSREPTAKKRQDFEDWKLGKTGSDFIDANMNELRQTGWLSNRGRQNVASFLAKELAVPWQLGAAYFEQQLIDYDVYSNWGNWAYLAGVGQDPRNRRFNSRRQAELYDPEGLYRARWLAK